MYFTSDFRILPRFSMGRSSADNASRSVDRQADFRIGKAIARIGARLRIEAPPEAGVFFRVYRGDCRYDGKYGVFHDGRLDMQQDTCIMRHGRIVAALLADVRRKKSEKREYESL